MEVSPLIRQARPLIKTVKNKTLSLSVYQETHEAFAQRIQQDQIKRVRLLQHPPVHVQQSLAEAACHINVGAVMANGRLELLHLLREVSISRDYHRYGNLGSREKEKRHPLPQLSDLEAIYSS